MRMHRSQRPFFASSTLVLLACLAGGARAAGGGDAPRAAQDPQTDITGVYAFLGARYDDPGDEVLNVLVQVRPVAQSGSGIVFPRFADDALYSIHLADPVTGEALLRYDFQFSAVGAIGSLKDPDSILSYGRGTELGAILAVGDERQNYVQTHTVRRRAPGEDAVLLAADLTVPPPNVGPRTTPFYNDASSGMAVSGAQTFAELDTYTATTIHDLPDGEAVFAGTRDEGFYADTPGIYDLLHPRLLAGGNGQMGGGPDAFADATALTYAIQIPLTMLPSRPYVDLFGTASSGVGVYASARRDLAQQQIGPLAGRRRQQQGSRMGNPLLCALVLPLRHKDAYQSSDPRSDGDFTAAVLRSELSQLFNAVFGTSFVEKERQDLVALYLPDVLRVDTTSGPVSLPGQVAFNRLSVFGGDTVGGHPGGWPNGRRPGDDVVDILFTVLASGPTFSGTTIMGDNVNANDQLYNQVFPYLGTPASGTNP